MLDAAFYELLQETGGAIFQAVADMRARSGVEDELPPPLLQLRAGLAESPGWYLVQAVEFAPEPLTVERVRVRDIYASERITQALLEMMASESWLERIGEEYTLTAMGWAMSRRSRERTRSLLAGLDPLPPADLAYLLTRIEQIITTSLESLTPPGSWCLAHSRNRAPDTSAPPLAHLSQYVSDLNAFRDDAHMAAWRPYEQSGAAWEAFSLVCGSEATSGAAIASQLAHRGYSPSEYGAALASLARRGWLESASADGAHGVTDAGWAIREAVERQTDSYFYAPWSSLSESEIERLKALLLQLQANLLQPASTH
jgi:hypothetical protein